jgi:nitric oxide reductase subunit B
LVSFIEVLPLVLLILEAIGQYRQIKAHRGFNYRLAYV